MIECVYTVVDSDRAERGCVLYVVITTGSSLKPELNRHLTTCKRTVVDVSFIVGNIHSNVCLGNKCLMADRILQTCTCRWTSPKFIVHLYCPTITSNKIVLKMVHEHIHVHCTYMYACRRYVQQNKTPKIVKVRFQLLQEHYTHQLALTYRYKAPITLVEHTFFFYL